MPKIGSKKWKKRLAPREPAPNVQFELVVQTNPADESYKKRLEDFELSDSDQSVQEIEIDTPTAQPKSTEKKSTVSEKKKYEGQFIEADKPVLNLIGCTPNIFDNATLVRELPEKFITYLLCCKTPNCLYVDSKQCNMDRHMKNCSGEAKTVIKQKRYGHDFCTMRKELFKDGFLPKEDYFQTFFISYDIETTMSISSTYHSDSKKEKFHNLATIACVTSEDEKIVFHRASMDYSDGLALVIRFLNYLNSERKKMVSKVPECITSGISFYNRIMEDPETVKNFSVGEIAKIREKLRYLQDFEKLKVYAWNGERYDLPVLYPMLISMLYEFSGRDSSKINIIKRGNGYMMIECNNISFRDFMNYAQRMSLEKLARSCGLDAEQYNKGCWPYEHFSSIDQILATKQFTQYTAYHSTLYFKSPKYAQEMNEMIYEKTVVEKLWPPNRNGFENYLIDSLNLENIQWDPVLIAAFENNEIVEMDDDELPIMDTFDYMVHAMMQIRKLFKYDFTKGCHQCDPESAAAMDFFRFSPRQYEKGNILWINMKRSLQKTDPDLQMDMMRFLYEYNLNDCYLLTGSIKAIAKKYAEKFKVGLHNDLSISKIAERIAFMQYDDTAPPIYSIPSTQPQFYDDCRKNLMGGIVQVLHRAVNLNGPSDYIPNSATIAPNGQPYKSVVVYDFTSLYPFIASGDTTAGPGIMYRPQSVATAPGGHFKEERFFGAGMFKGKENTSLESLRCLEWYNCRKPTAREPNPYYMRMLHSYNYKEYQFGNYFVDGTVIHDEFIDAEKKIKKKTFFEYRGCYYHPCPHCKKQPLGGMKTQIKIDGKWIVKRYSREELVQKDAERIRKIVEIIESQDGISPDPPEPYFDENLEKRPGIGPKNFYHRIVIIYGCEWMKTWKRMTRVGIRPFSYDYPFLFQGAYPANTGFNRHLAGVTEDAFKKVIGKRDKNNRSRFCGFAMVNLRSPQHVKDLLKHVPPIFAKKNLEPGDCRGRMRDVLTSKYINKIYPRQENIFCYDADNYLCTAPMLENFHDLGIEYKVIYFVSYYRCKPFKNLIDNLKNERIECIAKDDLTGANLCKLLMNSWIGRTALNKSKFMQTNIVGVDQLWKKMRTPRFKNMTALRGEGQMVDPLYEVSSIHRRITEDLPIHIQVLIYQNSKLLFFKFIRLLEKYLRNGSFTFCYCDTDSFMLAITEDSIDRCVKNDLHQDWVNNVKPSWFADPDCPRSCKEPGLLKIEAQINSGWFIALSAKCYIMATAPPSELERKILLKENRRRGLEVIAQFLANMDEPPAKILKRSAKGVKQNLFIGLYEYLACVFTESIDQQVLKDVPLIAMDITRKRMVTKIQTRKALNFVDKKRLVDDDCIRTYPLRNSEGKLL